MEQISSKAIEVITKFSVVKSNINSDDLLLNIGVDSLCLVELVIALEDEFNIQFDEAELEPSKLNTVGDIINLVKKYI